MKNKFTQSIGFKILFFYVLLALINTSFVIFIIFENQVELISKNTKIESELQFSNLINSIKKFSSEMKQGTLFSYNKNEKSTDQFLKLISPHITTYFIITEKNQILHRSVAKADPPKTMAEDILRSVTSKKFTGKEYYLRIDEKKNYIYCYIPLGDFQLGNTFLLAVKDISSLNESLKNLYRQAIYIVLVILFFHAMFALVLFKYIINPIKLLNEGAKRLSELDFEKRILFPGRNDEFGSLAEAYNDMADSIFENLKKLKDDAYTSKINQLRMSNLTVKDDLTDLYNRIYMNERIQEEVKKFHIKKSVSALLLIDVDNFKEIINIYGNKSGDIILLEISKIIIRNCNETDIISRFINDRFAVLSCDCSIKDIKKISEKIRSEIEKNTVITPDGKFTVTVSIGISLTNLMSKSGKVNDLINSADTALMQAKQQGKNRVGIIS